MALKLGKLLKKMHSITRTTTTSSSAAKVATTTSPEYAKTRGHCFPVFVGKSRRRYLVSGEVIGHPLFRELVDRSPATGDGEIAVACEVVLFEHLLWMLQNQDDPQHESLDDLVDFYAS